MYLAPGVWNVRDQAHPTGQPGVYTVELTAPKPGVYYLHVSSPSLNLELNAPDFLILRAVGEVDTEGRD